MPGGRPSKFNNEIAEMIVQRVREGLSFSSACQSIGIHLDTGSGWRQQFSEFSEAVYRAERESEAELLGVVRKAAIGHDTKTTKYIVSDKDGERIEETTSFKYSPSYAQWILARRFPEQWSEQRRIEQLAQAKFRESIQYLMAVVSDSAKAEISTALLAAGLEVSAIGNPAQAAPEGITSND
jgi:hypothetical protein